MGSSVPLWKRHCEMTVKFLVVGALALLSAALPAAAQNWTDQNSGNRIRLRDQNGETWTGRTSGNQLRLQDPNGETWTGRGSGNRLQLDGPNGQSLTCRTRASR